MGKDPRQNMHERKGSKRKTVIFLRHMILNLGAFLGASNIFDEYKNYCFQYVVMMVGSRQVQENQGPMGYPVGLFDLNSIAGQPLSYLFCYSNTSWNNR